MKKVTVVGSANIFEWFIRLVAANNKEAMEWQFFTEVSVVNTYVDVLVVEQNLLDTVYKNMKAGKVVVLTDNIEDIKKGSRDLMYTSVHDTTFLWFSKMDTCPITCVHAETYSVLETLMNQLKESIPSRVLVVSYTGVLLPLATFMDEVLLFDMVDVHQHVLNDDMEWVFEHCVGQSANIYYLKVLFKPFRNVAFVAMLNEKLIRYCLGTNRVSSIVLVCHPSLYDYLTPILSEIDYHVCLVQSQVIANYWQERLVGQSCITVKEMIDSQLVKLLCS